MPRVGSSIRSTSGRVLSQLPTTTFCWFPPLSVSAGTCSPGVLIAMDCTICAAIALAFARCSTPLTL